MRTPSPEMELCTQNAMVASIARRPFFSSATASFGSMPSSERPSGSKPMSPGTRPSVLPVATSMMLATRMIWKRPSLGVVTSADHGPEPSKRPSSFAHPPLISCTSMPNAASIARRPCLSSAVRYCTSLSSFFEKPAGSQKPPVSTSAPYRSLTPGRGARTRAARRRRADGKLGRVTGVRPTGELAASRATQSVHARAVRTHQTCARPSATPRAARAARAAP